MQAFLFCFFVFLWLFDWFYGKMKLRDITILRSKITIFNIKIHDNSVFFRIRFQTDKNRVLNEKNYK